MLNTEKKYFFLLIDIESIGRLLIFAFAAMFNSN